MSFIIKGEWNKDEPNKITINNQAFKDFLRDYPRHKNKLILLISIEDIWNKDIHKSKPKKYYDIKKGRYIGVK